MFLEFKIVRSTGIVRLINFADTVLYLSRTLKNVRARSSKYPILSTIYYTLLGYAVLNSFLAELPSNNGRSNEWSLPKSNVILTTLDCIIRLFTYNDLTKLSYDALLLFVQEK